MKKDLDAEELTGDAGEDVGERRRRRRNSLRIPSDNVPRRPSSPHTPALPTPVPEDPRLAVSLAYAFGQGNGADQEAADLGLAEGSHLEADADDPPDGARADDSADEQAPRTEQMPAVSLEGLATQDGAGSGDSIEIAFEEDDGAASTIAEVDRMSAVPLAVADQLDASEAEAAEALETPEPPELLDDDLVEEMAEMPSAPVAAVAPAIPPLAASRDRAATEIEPVVELSATEIEEVPSAPMAKAAEPAVSPPPPPADAAAAPRPEAPATRRPPPAPHAAGAARAAAVAAVVAPQRQKKRRARPWFEEVFDEDYLRTLPFLTPQATQAEAAFACDSLLLEPGSQVLDIGCGYGRHAMELAARGYHVVGLDASLPLLIRGADEAQRRGLTINFVHGDMRELTFDAQFDGAYCLFSTFGYFDDEANKKTAQNIARALKPGARFLVEILNRDYLISELPCRVWWEGDGCVVLEEVEYNYFSSRIVSNRSVVFDDGRQLEQEISMRAYSLHELGKLLHAAGFRILEVSGSMHTRGRFFGAQSREIVVLCERKQPRDGAGVFGDAHRGP